MQGRKRDKINIFSFIIGGSLLPKRQKLLGLQKTNVNIFPKALLTINNHYTAALFT